VEDGAVATALGAVVAHTRTTTIERRSAPLIW
jgi:hypothetical protein